MDNFIDVYINDNGNLVHYWANIYTNWSYLSDTIYTGVVTKCAITRNNNDIDLYFVTNSCQLVHAWVGDHTQWKYNFEVLLDNVAKESPTAVRFRNFIDVYCFDLNNRLVHLYVSDLTQWKYKK